ncbi:hypothetical protein CCMSSC00406_0010132 [Pleurotus cornucopiae]|uniref:Uncharacterized protein n=1 Tax=Pleurotus cornucopiae TaxID=5321 RepID=A0ACB7IJR4_PLECO|nr:hypothetical protein CCMSSC00406_0010132 [Pleurotus cornucopiae]
MPTSLVIGASRGLGLELAKLLHAQGHEVFATVRSRTHDLPSGISVISDIDIGSEGAGAKIVYDIGKRKLDWVIVNAGVFKAETLSEPNYEAEVEMYKVVAIAPVFIAHHLVKADLLAPSAKFILITTEGGSIALRTQEEGGGNHGHHGSKAAANMVGKLLAIDLYSKGVTVAMIHPGFMRTDMTKSVGYDKFWDAGGVFYPDNVPRRDRALQLQNDISLLQNNVKEARDAMDKEDQRMVPYLNQILKNHNMSTFDELQAKLNAALTPEQKQMYTDMLANSAKLTGQTDVALMAMSGILFTSGVVAKTIDIANFLRACNLVTVIRAYARAFITLVTEGTEAGARAFRLVSTLIRWGEETLAETSQVAKYAGTASRFLKVLAIVGIFADGFILAFDVSESASDLSGFADAEMIIQFYEQKKQKDELDKAIRELYVSRIIAKMYGSMCDAIKTQDGMMLSYLILVGDDGTIDPDDQRAADKIAGKLVDYVKQDWSAITTNSSLDLLVVLDKQRGSWTTDDPSYQDALDDAEDKLKADPPETPGSTGTSLSASKTLKAASHAIAKATDEFFPPPPYEATAALVHLEDMRKLRLVSELNTAVASKVVY